MESISEPTAQSPSSIPVVDFSAWTNSSNKAEQLEVAKQLTTACRDVGFVYITNHGLAQDLIDQAFHLTRQLFALSHAEKMQAPHPQGAAIHRGYSHPGLEKVSQYTEFDEQFNEDVLCRVQDCKESYEIGSEENDEQPNVWLPEETLPGFHDSTMKFYWECDKVARSILKAIALGIGLDEKDTEELLRFHSGYNNQLRLLHYPPVPAAELENGTVARMPAHSDWSSITLLFQDDCGGLEVEDPSSPGRFIPVTPVPRSCVLNIGDLLMRWSNGESLYPPSRCETRKAQQPN